MNKKSAKSEAQRIAAAYPGVELVVSSKDMSDYIVLEKIFVPKELRRQGVGSKVMLEFMEVTKSNKWKAALTPSDCFGSSVSRLKKFYKTFGFVENKGRNKDFTIMQSMVTV